MCAMYSINYHTIQKINVSNYILSTHLNLHEVTPHCIVQSKQLFSLLISDVTIGRCLATQYL